MRVLDWDTLAPLLDSSLPTAWRSCCDTSPDRYLCPKPPPLPDREGGDGAPGYRCSNRSRAHRDGRPGEPDCTYRPCVLKSSPAVCPCVRRPVHGSRRPVCLVGKSGLLVCAPAPPGLQNTIGPLGPQFSVCVQNETSVPSQLAGARGGGALRRRSDGRRTGIRSSWVRQGKPGPWPGP